MAANNDVRDGSHHYWYPGNRCTKVREENYKANVKRTSKCSSHTQCPEHYVYKRSGCYWNRDSGEWDNEWNLLTKVTQGSSLEAGDIRSLYFLIGKARRYWAEGSFGGISNTSIYRGGKIRASDWNSISTELSNLSEASGKTFSNIGTSDILTASRTNDLISAYNIVARACKCNSDYGTESVYCTCNVDCGCHYSSDKRLKENIEPITKSIINIEPYQYNYNDKVTNLPKTKQFGVMAQDLLDQGLSELVQEEDTGYFSVNYQMVIPLLLKELKENRRRIEILEGKLNGK